ncbi:MAG: hypothetical protein ABIT38_05500 [Gemmatimonadaceae bacterium]
MTCRGFTVDPNDDTISLRQFVDERVGNKDNARGRFELRGRRMPCSLGDEA